MNDDDDDPDNSGIEIVDTKPFEGHAQVQDCIDIHCWSVIPARIESKVRGQSLADESMTLLSVVQASIDPAAHAQCNEAKVSYSILLAHISALEAEGREKDSRVEKLQAELCECERGRNLQNARPIACAAGCRCSSLCNRCGDRFGAAPSSSLSAVTGLSGFLSFGVGPSGSSSYGAGSSGSLLHGAGVICCVIWCWAF